jgi:hypothetical protein
MCHHLFVHHLLLSFWWPFGLVVLIWLLGAYTDRADKDFNRGGGWRARLRNRCRRHPRIMAVQVLCLTVTVVYAVVQSR